MNISLAPQKKKAKKTSSSIGFGLNNRAAATTTTTITKKKSTNVFDGGSDDDDEEEEQALSGREQVNRQIGREQAALRKRAQAAAAAIQVEDPGVYDYDGAYDSFKEASETTKNAASKQQGERKSKYIGDLLKASKKRERERDVIHERKVAREQAEEDAKEEYQGKEKFITKAYKRKLEERKQWEAEDEEKEREEEANDVTKKAAGAAFAGFYGNFNRNVAMGGGDEAKENEKAMEESNNADDVKPSSGGLGFLSGFERTDDPADHDDSNENEEESNAKQESNDIGEDSPVPELSKREQREKKVAEARIRYLERKRLSLQQ
jgi:coiled-coil domain-containing protein 55